MATFIKFMERELVKLKKMQKAKMAAIKNNADFSFKVNQAKCFIGNG